MKRSPRAYALLVLCTLAPAQTRNLDLPSSVPFVQNNNFPFAGGIMRYQQWYSPADWLQVARHPIRIKEVWFKTTGTGQLGRTVDVQLTMANSTPIAPIAQFDSNLIAGTTVVFPRKVITLPTTAAGQYVLKFVFTAEFMWDGKSGVILEARVYGNGNNNQQFLYDLESTTASVGLLTRLYTVNNADSATAAIYQPSWGVTTRFVAAEGALGSFGSGCPGTASFEPVAGTSGGLPLAANASWMQTLNKAASGQPAAFVLGTSNTLFGTLPLPLDLSIITMPGCFLLVEPLVMFGTMTSGPGAGSGQALLPMPLPPVTSYVGSSAYGQWFVIDPGSPANGKIAASQGLWYFFGL